MSRVFRRQGSYWVDYNDGQGVRHRKKIGPSKRIAGEVLNDILNKVTRKEFLGIVAESSISFADFAKEWLAGLRSDLKPRTRERWQDALELHLKPFFKGALRALTAGTAESYVAQRVADGATASTINTEMTVLKNMMRLAVSREYLAHNPFRDRQGVLLKTLKPLKEPPGRVRYLAPDEIDALLAACQRVPYLKAFALTAVNSGMRRNEILSLTHESFDRINRLVRLTDTKNGEARIVPLNDVAFDALVSLPRRINNRLFPFGPNQVSVAFQRAVRRAGIENFHLHDLRHTFASYQAMAGVQGRGLQALLGHKDARMTDRYSHLSDTYLRAAVNAVQLGAIANTNTKAVKTG